VGLEAAFGLWAFYSLADERLVERRAGNSYPLEFVKQLLGMPEIARGARLCPPQPQYFVFHLPRQGVGGGSQGVLVDERGGAFLLHLFFKALGLPLRNP
jgi:hypothetical protein